MTIDAEKFLDENSGLIHKLANKFNLETSKFSKEDLVQEGSMAAIHALRVFDPERGSSKVTTYVYRAVYRAMRDMVRTNKFDVHYTPYQQAKDYKLSAFADTDKLSLLKKKPNGHLHSKPPTGNIANVSPTAIRLDIRQSDNGGGSEDGSSLSDIVASGIPPALTSLIKEEQVDILLEEISFLPEREREIIQSRYLEGKELAEIAATQGCTRQRIHQISNRAFNRLSEKVKRRLDNELFV